MKNISQCGRLLKYSSSSLSVLIVPCKSRKLVADRCWMTALRCRTILHEQGFLNMRRVWGRWNMENFGKGTTKLSLSSAYLTYLAMLHKLLQSATTNVNERITQSKK